MEEEKFTSGTNERCDPPEGVPANEPLQIPVALLPPRETRTLLKEVYKRVTRLAKDLWLGDVAMALVCTKCGQGLTRINDNPIILVCKCRERVVR